MRREATVGAVLLSVSALACGGGPKSGESPSPSGTALTVATVEDAQRAASEEERAELIVINRTTTDIELHDAYLVDVEGARGTLRFWPHRLECPEAAKGHRIERGATTTLPPPTHGYPLEGCERGPRLPAGEYLLKLESGLGQGVYAVAHVTLPLEESVKLHFVQHERPPPCTKEQAVRAARLALASTHAAGPWPDGLFVGCDATAAQCASSAEAPFPPPAQCAITFHPPHLRIDRPAGTDALRWMLASTDFATVYTHKPDVTRASASRVDIGGQAVIVAGVASHHFHEHGGNAAAIDRVELQVHNPLNRTLGVTVDDAAFLIDSQCGLPTQVISHPKVSSTTPASIARGVSSLVIGFAPQEAYQGHCDRFATQVTLRIEGHPVTVAAEHHVTRFEPMHELP